MKHVKLHGKNFRLVKYPIQARKGKGNAMKVLYTVIYFVFLFGIHYKLQSLDFAKKVLYHLISKQYVWNESKAVKLQLLQEKNKFIENLRTTTGILMDSPNQSTSGNTNSGTLAEIF